MTVINTNTASLTAQYHLSQVNKEMEQAMERLSSGQRVNSASDDAAGLAIASKMDAQIRGLTTAIRNANDGISLANTAEGAMAEVENMLQRMREIAVQSANGTYSSTDRANLDAEVQQLKAEIDRVVDTTRFNDVKLLDGSYSGSLQIGAKGGETMSLAVANMATTSLGTSSSGVTSLNAVEASATGTAATENVVNLTFNGNDSYSMTITLNNATEAADAGATPVTAVDQEISISNIAMAGNDATAIADAINLAIAGNATAQNGGLNLSGILSAKAQGSMVTLTNKQGTEIDITSFSSTGAGTMTVNPVTNTSAPSVTLDETNALTGLENENSSAASNTTAALQLQEGKAFQFRVNGTLIKVDDTAAGRAASSSGDLAGVKADAIADIKAAIEATSGAGTATVTDTNSSAGNYITLNMTDTSGNDIEITGFQKLSTSQVPNGFITVNADVSGTTTHTIDHDGYMSTDPTQASQTAINIDGGKTGRITFSDQNLKYTFALDVDADGTVDADESFEIDGLTKDFSAELTRVANEISAQGGINVTATNKSGVLEIVNNNASGTGIVLDNTAQLSAPGVAAVAEGTAYFKPAVADANGMANDTDTVNLVTGSNVSGTNGTVATPSQMSLTFSADDRYTFAIDKDGGSTADATITADVTNGDLGAVVNVINSHSASTGITASVSGNAVILEKADGTGFELHSFSSDSNGQIHAANAAGQGGAALMQNATGGTSATIGATGAAVETEMTLTFTEADTYSFKITDGTSTATVRATEVQADDAAGTADNATDTNPEAEGIKAEIDSALSAANMSHISVSITDDVITLKNTLGGEMTVTNFKSDGTGQMVVQPKTGQGVGKILDDNGIAGSSSAVSSLDVLSSTNSQTAISTIDRALENVASERSKLGAAVNRLDHTINNLSNVSTNTAAAKSRIVDADFAAETSNLTKNQILSQAATSMLAQANQSKQGILALLQG